MSHLKRRTRVFCIGVVGWIFVAAQAVMHLPFSDSLGVFHAGVAGAIIGLSLMPRSTLRWS